MTQFQQDAGNIPSRFWSILTWKNHTVADLLAAYPWCESPVSPHQKATPLDSALKTVEVIWVQWTHHHGQERHFLGFSASATVVNLLCGLKYCMLRDAPLHTLIITSDQFSYCQFETLWPLSSNLWHQQGIFCLSVWNIEIESPSGTSNHAISFLKSLKLPLFPILMPCIWLIR